MSGVNTDLDDFLDDLNIHVPFCPDFAKQAALRQSLSEFFEETRSWRATIEDQPVFAEDRWLDANQLARHVSPHALALAVDDMFLSDTKARLQRMDIETMDRFKPGWIGHSADSPVGFMVYADRRVRIYPAMTADAASVDLDLELVLTCDAEITVVPDYVFQFHRAAIVNGAAWRLLSQQGMPWTDPERSAFFRGVCRAEIDDGKNERALRAVNAANERSRRAFF
jgi:hypothetical protein